jgi:transcriptional regulator with XRE-family HTH domain
MINVREQLDPKISLWHFLAYYLRFQREKQGLSLAQWGQIIGAARSTVSNIEAGRRKLGDDQAKVLDDKWQTGGLFELLLWYARTAHDPDWFRSYTQYEAEATVIRIYQGQVIPIPLQTEAYTRMLLKEGDTKDIDAEVEDRMARQAAILGRADPPLVWALLDESALECQVGGFEIMREQLQRLVELSELPHVSIRLIPKNAGAHLGLDGPFRIISLESRDVAYAGAQRGGRLIEATGEVRELRVDYERIGMKALPEDASRALFERLLEKHP